MRFSISSIVTLSIFVFIVFSTASSWADANIKASNGATALSIAAKNDDTEIVKMLRKYGAKE